MACRATDGAATAATDGMGYASQSPPISSAGRQEPTAAPRHQTAPFSTFHQYSHGPGPDSPENNSESKKKPPSAIILRNDPRRRHDDGAKAP